jgi:hypothetical protein
MKNSDVVFAETRLFFLVDNRLQPQTDVVMEAYLSSFYRGITHLFSEFCSFLFKQPWAIPSVTVVYAAAPQTTQLIDITSDNRSFVTQLLEPRFYCLGGNDSCNVTWQYYLSDGLRKIIQNIISRPNFQDEGKIQKTVVVIYSTEVSMFGHSHSGFIEDGLKYFSSTCEQLFSLKELNVEIRIVSFGLFRSVSEATVVGTSSRFPMNSNNSDNSNSSSNRNDFLLNGLLFQKFPSSSLGLERIICSVASFDEELKSLIGIVSPKCFTKLVFPSFQSLGCSILIKCQATSLQSLKEVFSLVKLEICGLTTRTGISPLYLSGSTLDVTVPSLEEGTMILGSKEG